MSDTKNNVDLNKNDELIKKESAFVDLLSMEINKKIIGQKKIDRKTAHRASRQRAYST